MTASAIDIVRFTWAHADWANARLFDTVRHTGAPVIDAPAAIAGGMGNGSIRHAVAHIVEAERLWYERWMGDERVRSRDSDLESLGDVPAIEADWRARAVIRRQWLANLDDRVLDEVFTWRRTAGNRESSHYWQSFLQVTNHGTHHRAEICVALTAAGISPPGLEVGDLLRELKYG